MKKLAALARSFRYAGRGIVRSVRAERNLRIHLCAVVFVILTGAFERLSAAHWAIELVCCALVISLELVNTALENVCDALCPEQNAGIGAAKDACAGAVLAAALFSAAVWVVILLRGGGNAARFFAAFSHPALPCLLALWAFGSALIVFLPEKSNDTEE